MRIAVTGDNHLDFLHQAEAVVFSFLNAMAAQHPDISLNLGDMTNGRLYDHYHGLDKLMQDQWTFYVLGNHDLWSQAFSHARRPDEAFRYMTKKFSRYAARPLEKSFSDKQTFWQSEELDCALVGAMGFPDFEHPVYKMTKEYYEKRHCTNDVSYIDLSLGWLRYTNAIKKAFAARLAKAVSFDRRNVVIATHYPIFEGQSKLSSDDISAYFFCHGMGQHILEVAKANPDSRFWCVAAHAHDYCRGELRVEADNVASYGLEADYGRLTFALIDTSKGFDQKVETAWLPGRPYVPVIDTVQEKTILQTSSPTLKMSGFQEIE